jgi:hypothetical protein
VLALLRSIDWGGSGSRAISSLNLADHLYQRWGEIDFLLVGTRGIVVIEVKGGDASCEGGVWRYEDRWGRVVTRGKSPMVQAKDAFFSLDKNYVAPEFGKHFLASLPAGFCTIFAGMTKADLSPILGGPEFPPELVGSREDLANPRCLQTFLEGVATYWRQKNSAKPRVDERDVTRLVAILRPQFELVRPLSLARDRLKEELVALTQEQYALLDHWEGAERVFCSAPAGCGKTLLAVEMTRRARAAGESAMLLVGTSQLAQALRETSRLDCIQSIEELEALPVGDIREVQTLVIDEGQQLFTEARVRLAEACVTGGLSSAKWAWFGDANYQLPNEASAEWRGRFEGAATVRPRLTRNCRNTPEIVTSSELASGAPMGHAIVAGRGLHPTMVGADDVGSAVNAIAARVSSWLEQGIEHCEIAVLFDGQQGQQLMESACRIGSFAASTWTPKPAGGASIRYAGLDSFRGLESPFLVLCLGEVGMADDELARRLYLGMTRGNFALEVIAPHSVIARVRARMAFHAERAMAKGE